MKHIRFNWFRIAGLALLGVSSGLAWGDALSLDQAVDAARANSPEIQKLRSSRTQAEWRRVETYSGFLPKVTGTANYLMDKKYVFTDIEFGGNPTSIPGIVPTTTFGLNGTWSLFDGFASTNRYRSARAFEDAAGSDLRWTEFKITRQVVLEYYRALAAQTLRQVAETNLKTLRDHLNDAKQLRQSGLATNFDLLRVEVQVTEAESDLLNATDNVEVAEGRLAEVLGRTTVVEPSGKLPELPPSLVETVGDTPTSREDLNALNERGLGYDYSRRAANSHWVPRLAAYGTYTYYNNLNNDYDDWDRFRNAYQLGLQLSWDLFDGFAARAQAHQVAEQRVQNDKLLEQQRLKAQQDIRIYKRKFKYFCQVYKSRQGNIGKAQESVRLAREGRKVGARTSTDLLDAEGDLHTAEAGAVNAQLGAIEALINVELSSGQELFKFDTH